MGRGRAKAKQTQVARRRTYSGPDTDLERLDAEVTGKGHDEPDEPEPSEPEPTEESCLITDRPHYGVVSNLFSSPAIEQLYQASSANDFAFTLDIGSDQYGFVAYPAALGEASFRQGTSVTGPAANWNGATWAQGDSAGDTGPVMLRIDDQPWFIYRTEGAGGGSQTVNLDIARSGAINDAIECDVSDYPLASEHSFGWATVIHVPYTHLTLPPNSRVEHSVGAGS